MKRIIFAALLLAAFWSAPALAHTKVVDWTAEKRTQDQHCNASRGKRSESRWTSRMMTTTASKSRTRASARCRGALKFCEENER
jgi:hypothetical protein